MFKPILVFLAFIVLVGPTTCRKRHVINFRWHNLYPESFIWDPKSEHFVVGSLRQQTLISVSDAGVTSSLLSDASLPSNSSFLGLALDLRHHRLLAVVHRPSTLTTPAFNALASYHLSTFDQLFLTPLPPTTLPFTTVANDVAVDFSGNTYVTDSANDAIYKINIEGQASILSKSQAFKSHPVEIRRFFAPILGWVGVGVGGLPELQCQQSYVNNKQLNCQQNDTTTIGFVCNGAATSCRSYLTFRSTPTYNNPITIAYLLAADASEIARFNNISDVSVLPVDTLVVVPVNCSCSGADSRYQHNASYTIKIQGETYFSVANDTYQALTTCQAMEANNPYDFRNLVVNLRLNVPLWCACPTSNQTAAGYKYLLTYLIKQGDSYSYIADAFSGAGADIQGILNANKLSANNIIFYFTPILVPLTKEPTKENINTVSQPPPPPPPPPTLPSTPSDQSGGSSRKWVFVGVGIGAAVLFLVLLSAFLFWFSRRRHRRRRHQYSPTPPSLIKKLNNESVEAQPWSVSSEGIRNAIETLTVYKFEDVQKATGSFAEANRINGSVYQGSFKGDVAAVKVMKGDVSREIDVLRQINHSHIIRLSGFCLHQGITYLVYEYAEKGSLSDWLHNNKMQNQGSYNSLSTGILDWKQRVQIAYDIVDALNYLHNFTNPPYIHKNLKSSNILLDGNIRAKVANFGLARSSDNDNSVPIMTRHVGGHIRVYGSRIH
ncbi:Protein LYK5 [Abeliophyllum distichum]|uniref:Protein LYK5 n=1 Tax=Abeliophyllum distichum TaxID=126358 RepID=A0ABD1T040_9LAMI